MKQTESTKKPLKVGVIGFNQNGRGHATRISESPKTELVAVADLVNERREQARELFEIENVYRNYNELLRKSDAEAVIISLPVPLHHLAAMAALKMGKHVFCEKPPAANARQTQKMVDLARDNGLTLTWGLQRRFLPSMLAARKAFDERRFGNVYRIDAHYIRSRFPQMLKDRFRMHKNGGGVFFDFGVHVLDMAWWLIGCPHPTRIVAANHTAFPDWNATDPGEPMAEDNSMVMIFFETGPVITIETCFYSQRQPFQGDKFGLSILGDKGGASIPSLDFYSGGPDKVETKKLKSFTSNGKNPGIQLLENFADAISGKAQLVITPEHGVQLMRMIDAVIKSADQNREIRLK